MQNLNFYNFDLKGGSRVSVILGKHFLKKVSNAGEIVGEWSVKPISELIINSMFKQEEIYFNFQYLRRIILFKLS